MKLNIKKVLAIGSVLFAGVMAMVETFSEQKRDKDIDELKKRVSELEND